MLRFATGTLSPAQQVLRTSERVDSADQELTPGLSGCSRSAWDWRCGLSRDPECVLTGSRQRRPYNNLARSARSHRMSQGQSRSILISKMSMLYVHLANDVS